MHTRTFTFHSLAELRTRIESAVAEDFCPSLAITFSSISFEPGELRKIYQEYDMEVLGCSAAGVFCVDKSIALHESAASVIALLDLNRDLFRVKLFERTDGDSFTLGRDIGSWGKEIFEKPVFMVLITAITNDGEKVFQGITDATGPDIPVYGSLAGDEGKFQSTSVYSREGQSDRGAVVLVMDAEKVTVDGVATSGWVGLGVEKTITRSRSNIVYTIDNEPALEVYKKYLGVKDEEMPEIGVEFPLLMKRDKGHTVLRAVLDVNRKEGSLIFAGSLPEGSRVKFASTPGLGPIDQVKKDLAHLKETLRKTDFLIVFSCIARLRAFGPSIEEEIMAAYETWGVPLIGFFCYGEIGKIVPCTFDFHNETFTLVAIEVK